MEVVTAQQMQQIDKRTIEELGIPGVVLMENAGRAVVDTAWEMLDYNQEAEVVILAGGGNNGGDGFVAARLLDDLGVETEVLLVGESEAVSGDAEVNLNILQKLDYEVRELQTEDDLEQAADLLAGADLVIDALLGTGIKGDLRGLFPDLIGLINESEIPVLAVDIPSGLDAETGQPHGRAVKADVTLTFALPKLGLVVYPGSEYAGRLEVADISIPDKAVEAQQIKREWITADLARDFLPKRASCSHKGSFGQAAVIAGSEGMTGAAKLSSLAVLKSGAGIATLGVPKTLHSILEEKLTEVMTKPLPETRDSCLSLNSFAGIKALSREADVMAVGPGMSRSTEITYILHDILGELELPLVIDADGINAVTDLDLLADRKAPTVLTPHPGEMARLVGTSVAEIEADRIKTAAKWAKDLEVTIVLKGAATVIATADGRAYINSTGNSGLATAGSGDVLTGIITGLMAQGLTADEAAVLGVFLHGLTADLALEEETTYTLLAGDLIDNLAQAFRYLQEE
ncbi:bifunctional ADP-dependent NAD(P)H-hydrate dehydratase/NAD(P)H-hydrate epimerase [Acetohalobium arabaticum]|uniref:Bifunctional NAD(P)H-hydrate repair enzyme n=1 Tax=Acetohalobium arabaticum (strain ATCC 49924 / DSM 5501 / Z-7288) TaxID=574087 RepID=D9QT91_ACEAZ|nr:bifunctional ADP-dependent NAD(P)H-hydrate dehydratase/NAD(P)H-hydrate epimerase [Acetohalobium arabaticum]ADL13591.1 carbohydrate kinase, YjeF related protein [Acetohalobium arabaticum DSM 5501]